MVLTLLAAGHAFAQAATGSLEARVRRGPGTGPVQLWLQGAGLERTATADDRGRAIFLHLRPGTYRLEASTGQGPCGARRIVLGAGQALAAVVPCGEREDPPAPRDRTLDPTARFPSTALRAVPRPTDPWSVLRDVPGVVVDRVNVGGSETAQQSLLVGRGDAGAGAVWTLDGADVTDPAAPGFTSIYPDMDALESLHARSGAFDVRVRTPGVQVGLVLREPSSRFAGGAHLRIAPDALQGDNLPPALASRSFLRSRTDRVLELGGEAGGPLGAGRLWAWGAASLASLRQRTFTEHGERLRTISLAAKARWRLGEGSVSLLALRAEKVHDDRDTGFSAAPAARWRQSGPSHLLALEDQRRLGRWSLLSRVSYLDAGFRLDPQGGMEANAFEDGRGVFQGSYLRLETSRPRLQLGVEAARRRRFLSLDHDLVLGTGYRRSAVSSFQGWPGNRVVGLSRQSVFFRAFRLTGFALPTRDLRARSVQGHFDAYAQDSFRWGRVSFVLGARLDRLRGENQPSSVEANPVFPDRLPAVRYPGGGEGVEWTDLLPRAAVAWDVRGDGRLEAGVGYAAYGASLASGDVGFDSPLAQPATLTYYWVDRNADGAVQANELDTLRGLLAASGLDPGEPAAITGPNRIAPGLRSPRTNELTAWLQGCLGPALRAGVRVSFRRLTRTVWRPLRDLTLADYVARGSVQGELLGRPYDVIFFAPASVSKIAPGNGRVLANREGYGQDDLAVEARAAGRVGRRADWEVWGAYGHWYERFTDFARAVQDPTPLDTEPLRDGGRVAVRPGGLGRDDVFVGARWSGGGALLVRLPARVEAAVNAHARDGFPVPYIQVASTGDPTAGAKSVLIAPRIDSFRLPALVIVDARVARPFAVGRGTLRLSLDVFNLLNASTALQVARDIELPAFDRPREIVRPRIVRVGLEYRF